MMCALQGPYFQIDTIETCQIFEQVKNLVTSGQEVGHSNYKTRGP